MSEKYEAAKKAAELVVTHGPQIAKTAAVVGIAGVGLGVADVAGLALENHRNDAHRNAKPHPWLMKLITASQRSVGMEPTIWASVHRRPHHGHTDTSLYPMYKIVRAMNWMEENPDHDAVSGIEVPETFEGLDPKVDLFTRDEVKEIGNMAVDYVKERLGDEYKEPEPYTHLQLDDVLHPVGPQYYYPDIKKVKGRKNRHKGPYTQDEEARIMLTDPHSPSLEPPTPDGHQNGVNAMRKNNFWRYKVTGNYFKDMPSRKDEDLKLPQEIGLKGAEQPDKKIKHWPYVAGSIAVISAATFAARRKYNWQGAAEAVVIGGAIKGVATKVQVRGGGEVNSDGHAGKYKNRRDLLNARYAKVYDIPLNEEGGMESDTTDAGLAGKVLKYVTMDEDNQWKHHKYANQPDYTEKKGWRGFIDAPYGTIIRKIRDSKSTLIQPGDDFEVSKGQPRPDEPQPGVARIRQIRLDQHEGRRTLYQRTESYSD